MYFANPWLTIGRHTFSIASTQLLSPDLEGWALELDMILFPNNSFAFKIIGMEIPLPW